MADVPSLLGCATQGETKEEALENIKEAIELRSIIRQAGLTVTEFVVLV